jgi:hypothetical protein
LSGATAEDVALEIDLGAHPGVDGAVAHVASTGEDS